MRVIVVVVVVLEVRDDHQRARESERATIDRSRHCDHGLHGIGRGSTTAWSTSGLNLDRVEWMGRFSARWCELVSKERVLGGEPDREDSMARDETQDQGREDHVLVRHDEQHHPVGEYHV